MGRSFSGRGGGDREGVAKLATPLPQHGLMFNEQMAEAVLAGKIPHFSRVFFHIDERFPAISHVVGAIFVSRAADHAPARSQLLSVYRSALHHFVGADDIARRVRGGMSETEAGQ